MSDEFLMKGKVYSEHKHKLVYPVIPEIKYDEIRLHVRRVGGDEDGAGKGHIEFLSYSGKPLHNLGAWAHRFWDLMSAHGIRDLDIGVLVNGNFNDSYRWTRSSSGYPPEKLDKKTGKVAPALFEHMVQFYLFDLPDHTAMPFEERMYQRDALVAFADGDFDLPMNSPQAFVCHCEADVDRLFVKVREDGYEGLMVKTRDHLYKPGARIDGWLKMKPEDTADGIITAVHQAVSILGEPLDRAGSVTVTLADGSAASPAGIAHDLGRLMLARPQDYIGQWCEFKYMERDRAGGYRHPSLVRLREAK